MRLVIKVGTSVITKDDGTLDLSYFKNISRQINHLRDNEILIVSSGAIGVGMSLLNMKLRPRDIKVRQTCASLGQATLINHYQKAFSKYNILVSQVLLTHDVFDNRITFLNLRNCINESLKRGIIPIFNENDVISIKEIDTSFGDNDYLSFLIAQHFNADALIMLTSVDGLYTKNPKMEGAELIRVVTPKDKPLVKSIRGKSSGGVGGMQSKLNVGFMCMKSGINMYIINGKEKDSLMNYESKGTHFIPLNKSLSSKQRWILTTKPKGRITIDERAYKALIEGKNLLFAGIKSVHGNFKKNDVVSIIVNDKESAKIICDYPSRILLDNKGKKSTELEIHPNVHKRENIVFLS